MKRVVPYLAVLLSTLLVAFVLLAMGWYAAGPEAPAIDSTSSDSQPHTALIDPQPEQPSDNRPSPSAGNVETLPEEPGETAKALEEKAVEPGADAQPEVLGYGSSLRVTVLDPAGEPVRPVLISVEVKPGLKGKWRWVEKFREDDLVGEGPFDLPIPRELKANKNAAMTVYVVVEGYAFEKVGAPGSATEVEVRLVEPAYLILDVPNANDYRDLRVFWKLVGELGEFFRAEDSPTRALPGGGGVYTSPFRSALVPPGNYTLEIIRTSSVRGGASLAPGGWGDLVLDRFELELKPGRNDFSAKYPVLHRLTVTTNGPQPRELRLVSSKGVELPLEEREEENCFPFVPAGEWVLCDEFGRQQVSVDYEKTVEFAPLEADCIQIAELPDDCSMAQAGFRSGDLVVAVNGVEITDMRSFRGPRQDELQTWTVLRDGTRQDVSFNYREVLKRLPDELKPDLTRPWRREGWPEELRIP